MTENVLDPSGEIIASKRFSYPYADNWYFLNYDIRQSTTSIIDSAGAITKNYEYEAFGTTSATGQSSFLNEVQFTGAVSDTNTGLYYMNARYYNPNTGRFLSQDTYKGSAYEPWTQHLYTYVGNNPVNMVDPTGHMPVDALNGLSILYNSGVLSAQHVSLITLFLNINNIYNGFHEIAQLNVAKKLFEMGYSSTLEYGINYINDKGVSKKVEADVVSGKQVWEVKPIGKSPKAQLDIYTTGTGLKPGTLLQSQTINNIPIIGDYKMQIICEEPGEAHYSFYKGDEVEETVKSTVVRREVWKRKAAVIGSAIAAAGVSAYVAANDVTGIGVLDDVPGFAFAWKIIEKAIGYAIPAIA